VQLATHEFAIARHTGDAQAKAWGLLDQAESLLPLGEANQALALIEAVVEEYVPKNIGRPEEIWAYGLLGRAQLRLGERLRAVDAAARALELTSLVPPIAVYTMEGYAGMADVYLHLWEEALVSREAKAEKRRLADRAKRASAALRQFAHVMPVAQPRALIFAGLVSWLLGRSSRARTLWQNARRAADHFAMPYDGALADFEMGRHSDDEGRRREFLIRAGETFDRLDAAYDGARVKAELRRVDRFDRTNRSTYR
jgi:tetratricopeptide (TPR) repeat protein